MDFTFLLMVLNGQMLARGLQPRTGSTRRDAGRVPSGAVAVCDPQAGKSQHPHWVFIRMSLL